MRLLLDTHVFIWAVMDDPRLNQRARAIIEEASGVYVSAASIWEIAIKSRLGKLDADPEDMVRAIDSSGFIELPVSSLHAARVVKLPLNDRHKDPFDRLLVAQSMVEPLVLLSADPKLSSYGGLVQQI
ncbi:MAG: type II toxin-antitoxin system VapC family toxin [Sulfuricellaceae bacterium]